MVSRSRVIGPGGRPSSSDSAFSIRAIWRSSSGIDGGRLRAIGLDPIELETIRHTAVQAVLEIRDGLVVQAERLPGDLELQVELAQQEVVRGDVANQRHQHAAPALVGREHHREGRFLLAPDSAEQIEFPRQLEPVDPALMRRVVVLRRGRGLPHSVVDDAIDLGIQERLGDPRTGACLFDARHGDRRSRLLAMASRMSACSTGSSNTWNHGRIGQRSAPARSPRRTGIQAASAAGDGGSWGRPCSRPAAGWTR